MLVVAGECPGRDRVLALGAMQIPRGNASSIPDLIELANVADFVLMDAGTARAGKICLEFVNWATCRGWA